MRPLFAVCIAAALAAAQTPPAPPAQPAPPAPLRARTMVLARGGAYLGVGAAEIDAERAKALGLKEDHGVEIKSVDQDSAAAKAGIKVGDVVLEYNGQRVEGVEQFTRLVRETPVGRQVKLTIWRGGSTQTLTASMGTRSGRTMRLESGDNAWTFDMPELPRMPAMPVFPDLPMPNNSWRMGMLGVESESLTPQLAAYFGVKEGVLVRSVIENTPAEKAGIKAGDVIVKVDDTKVSSPREITSVLRSRRSRGPFPVVVMRKGQEMTLTVTIDDNTPSPGKIRALLRDLTMRWC